jgi:hypothetical protein
MQRFEGAIHTNTDMTENCSNTRLGTRRSMSKSSDRHLPVPGQAANSTSIDVVPIETESESNPLSLSSQNYFNTACRRTNVQSINANPPPHQHPLSLLSDVTLSARYTTAIPTNINTPKQSTTTKHTYPLRTLLVPWANPTTFASQDGHVNDVMQSCIDTANAKRIFPSMVLGIYRQR